MQVELATVCQRGRLYLDVDGAFSPICPQPRDHGLLHPTRRVQLHAGRPPETGWRWELCAHGLGPTPVPVELAQGLVALDRTEVEVVWLTSWQTFANELLPVVGLDDAFRSTDLETTSLGDDWKWAVVHAESARDRVPFVWVDDQMVDPSTWRWHQELIVPGRLVRTNVYHGLTPATWTDVLGWLESECGCDLSAVRAASAVR